MRAEFAPSAVASISPAISVAAGPEVFGAKVSTLSSPIVSEGLASLENTMPISGRFNPVGEIKFNALGPEDGIRAVKAAEEIIFQAQQPPAKVKSWVLLATEKSQPADALLPPRGIMQIEPSAMPLIILSENTSARMNAQKNLSRLAGYLAASLRLRGHSAVSAQSNRRSDSRSSEEGFIPDGKVGLMPKADIVSSPVSVAKASVADAESVQQEETEEQTIEEAEQQLPQSGADEEEREVVRKYYLVDEKALAQRLYDVRQALEQARLKAGRLGQGEKILGKLVAGLMPLENDGNRSQIVQPRGPDGSYEQTRETIEAGKFATIDEVIAVVFNNRPVRMGEHGKPVACEEVRKVDRRRLVKRSSAAVEIMHSRLVKKRKYFEETN